MCYIQLPIHFDVDVKNDKSRGTPYSRCMDASYRACLSMSKHKSRGSTFHNLI